MSHKKDLPQKLEIHRRLRTSNQHLDFCFLSGKKCYQIGLHKRPTSKTLNEETKLTSDLQKTTCLCLESAEIKDAQHWGLKTLMWNPTLKLIKENIRTRPNKIYTLKNTLNKTKFAQELVPASDKWIYTKLKTFVEQRKQCSGEESLPAMHLIED